MISVPLIIKDSSGDLIHLNLMDEATLENRDDDKILIKATGDFKIVTNHESPIYKAVQRAQGKAKGKRGLNIHIQKNIPSFSGLNSQNNLADYILHELNTRWDLNLDEKEMSALHEPKKLEEKVLIIRPKYIRNTEHLDLKVMLKHFPDLTLIKEALTQEGLQANIILNGPFLYGLSKEEVRLPASIADKCDFIRWLSPCCNPSN